MFLFCGGHLPCRSGGYRMRAVWIILMAALLPGLALAQGAGEQALAEGEALTTDAQRSQQRVD